MAEDPSLTLAEVARKSGVSERTASRIRSESQPRLKVAER
jgi:transcriptional regulator with XRE-family HTH domain